MSVKKLVRLNYTIPNQIAEKLNDYCDYTGRSASDVIRQLVVDYVQERILIKPMNNLPIEGKRTNLSINSLVLDAFDNKLSSTGTRGSVIAQLLNDYLMNRVGDDIEEGYTSCFKVLKDLVEACENRKTTNINNGVEEVNFWKALHAGRVFVDQEVEIDVC